MFKGDSNRRAARMLAIAVTISIVGGNLSSAAYAQTGSAQGAAQRAVHGKAVAFQLPMNGQLCESSGPQTKSTVGAPVPGNGMIIEEVSGWNDEPGIASLPPKTVPPSAEETKTPAERLNPNAIPFNMQEGDETPSADSQSSQDSSSAESQSPQTQQSSSAQPATTGAQETQAQTPAPTQPTQPTQPAQPLTGQVETSVPKVETAREAIEEIETAAESRSQEASAVLVIDNDGDEPQKAEVVWKEIQDEPGKTKIISGATFPITMMSSLNSKTAKSGQPIEARLNVDIKIGGKLIAKKGDLVRGHVTNSEPARRILHAELSRKRWMRANGAVGLQFDEIINYNGEHLPLVAKPAQHARIVKNKAEGRVLGVNHNGEVAAPLSTQLKHQAAHLAIRGAASAGGVFSFGIVPLAYGVVGAMNPSFAFLHPVGTNVPHRRLKGFAMGVVSGLPGGFLIADTIIRGQEAVVKPGDQFEAEFKQEFTGEAATEATLIPGASSKVKGEVLTDIKSKKK